MAAISAQSYTPTEEAEIQQWLTTSTRLRTASSSSSSSSPDAVPQILDTLNAHLASRTTLLGAKPSVADVAIYKALAPLVAAWTPEQRTGEQGRPHVVRLVDFVQNSPLFEIGAGEVDKIGVELDEVLYVKPPVDAKAEKERLKKEKAAAAAAAAAPTPVAAAAAEKPAVEKPAALPDRTKPKEDAAAAAASTTPQAGQEKPKKEKKEKAPKPQKAPAATAAPSPSLIDLRVGHILKCIPHPDADSLFVSTIAVNDPPNTEDTTLFEDQVCRTVCSGLNGLVPLAEMQGRKVIVVCNLKPVKMRGIKSCAMVLAASPKLKEGEVDEHKGPVELVAPPEGAKAGERVFFEGWKGEPEGVLNPKKKVWEMFQPGFTTTEDLEVAFDAGCVEVLGKTGLGKLVTEAGGVCTVPSLKGATVR